jgi:hypothetical protein
VPRRPAATEASDWRGRAAAAFVMENHQKNGWDLELVLWFRFPALVAVSRCVISSQACGS